MGERVGGWVGGWVVPLSWMQSPAGEILAHQDLTRIMASLQKTFH